MPWLSTIQYWLPMVGAFLKTYFKILIFFLLLPSGALIITLGSFGIYTRFTSPDAALQWAKDALPWLIGLSGLIAGGYVSIKDRHALAEITRPRIKMEYHGTDFYQNSLNRDRTTGVLAYIKITGLCARRVDFHVYCSDVVSVRRGSQNLLFHVGEGEHRFLTRTEPHILKVLLYEWGKVPAPLMECLVASQKHHADTIERGDEFIVTISAYGSEMEPAHIQLRCRAADQRFDVEEVKPMPSLNPDAPR